MQAAELDAHRSPLFKFALLHLRDHALAEDAVQDTLEAACQGLAEFRGAEGTGQAGSGQPAAGPAGAGGATPRTWLIGILKHKIVDCIRKSRREPALGIDAEPDAAGEVDALFHPDGHWVDPGADWGDPEQAYSQRRFFEVLERCMAGLPASTARVFYLREVAGQSNEEICAELAISDANYWVLLYRARLRLRECLNQRWFAGQR
jgi:RNA polymerase sigma-70 factor (ECF subfamily)